MTERIHNFSAGPAVLPIPVLQEAQRDMLSLPGVGMSVMEISHRSKTFDEIFQSAETGLRQLLGIPNNYHVLFLQGGASLQFSMIPMNFLPAEGSADYVITGSWGKKALKEAKRAGVFENVTGILKFFQVTLVKFCAFTLQIRPELAADARPFVPRQPQPFQSFVDGGHRFLGVALHISVFNAQQKLAAGFFGVEPIEKRRARRADVQIAGW